jgi:CBS domain containing-hemolysin-like protein
VPVPLSIIDLLHVVVGEQAPTRLGIERTKLVARYGAPPLYWRTGLVWPVVLPSDRIARGLLGLFGVEIARSWAEEGLEGGEDGEGAEPGPQTRGEVRQRTGDAPGRVGVSEERRREVLNALRIGQTPVAAITVDADEVVAVSTTERLDENSGARRSRPTSGSRSSASRSRRSTASSTPPPSSARSTSSGTARSTSASWRPSR